MSASSQYGRFGSGKAVTRVEDASLLMGAGQFVDDHNAAGQGHVLFLRSPYAHARIVRIDVAAAAAMPGVVAIVTGPDLVRSGIKPLPTSADFRRAGGAPTAAPPRHALAIDTVRFVGEAVAAVVAQTRDQARDALEAIDVQYESLPSVVDSTAAVMPDAPQVWNAATGNIAAEIRHGDAAATAKAFGAAAHVVTLDLVNQRLAPCPIEPRGLLASFDAGSGRITLAQPARLPPGCATRCATKCSGIAHDKVRVLVGRCRRRLRDEDGVVSRGTSCWRTARAN